MIPVRSRWGALGCWIAVAGAALAGQGAAGADTPPAWLIEAGRAATTPGEATPAEILLLDHRVEVHPGGRIVTIERGALRILDAAGVAEATISVYYRRDAERVRRLAAWIMPASGPSHELGYKEESDVAVIDEATYGDARMRSLDGTRLAATGSVFGWEWTREERSIFTQILWPFQPGTLPCRVSRFTLELPTGWRAQGSVVRSGAVGSRIEGDRNIWELRDIPHIADEPARPPLSSLVPMLMVSWEPPPGRGGGDLVRFTTWSEVAQWLDQLTEPMSAPTPESARRATELVRGARTEAESLRAVARFAQSVRYASLPLGVHRGGGYKPYPAGVVLSRTYGDCKDKANLMRSLLQSVGIESHLVAVYSGDPEFVTESWPSTTVFNHCIIGVNTRGTYPTTLADSTGRRWTFFDPTDPATELGDLPREVQGALALMMASDTRAPRRLPRIGANRDRFERQVTAKLDEDGTLQGYLEDRMWGQMSRTRRRLAGFPEAERTQTFQRWLASTAAGVRVKGVDVSIEGVGDMVLTRMGFEAPRYAKLMKDRIMVFRPLIQAPDTPDIAKAGTRRWPVDLGAWASFDTVSVRYPTGFKADELPEPVVLETPFGRYATTVVDDGAEVRVTRELVLQPRRIPATEFAVVHDFFRRARAADQAPVVLTRE